MRVLMTLVVRDEQDVIETWLDYHLARGIDGFVITDNGSVDGTREILERYRARGLVTLFDEPVGAWEQAAWVTRMARAAAVELAADWVLHSDADEFWWPRGDTIHGLLAAVPGRFGVVRGLWRHFVLVPDGPGSFADRMTHRIRPVSDRRSPYHAQVKIAHRAAADVEVSWGNHDATGNGLVLIREWFPFEVLHFPLRDRAGAITKYTRKPVSDGVHVAHARERAAAGDEGATYRDYLYDGEALSAGLASGTLLQDVRLRDAIRLVREGATSLPVWVPTLHDEVDLAVDVDMVLRDDSRIGLDRRAARVQTALDRVGRSVALRLTGTSE